MGTTILIIAVVIEIAFVAYCLVTQSSQLRVRGFVRLGALAAFVIFTLAGVVEWSFRWYALAALLLVWSALGAWTLVRKTPETRAYRASRIVFGAVGTLVLVVIAVTLALLFPQHRPPRLTGTLEVATARYTYTDANRIETFTASGEHRQVNVKFWYPKAADGKYPLVVFSHGAFGMQASNTSTFMELASHGYVVSSIDHPYHALFTLGADGQVVTVDRAFLQEFTDSNKDLYDGKTQIGLYHKWMTVRTADIRFVLDTIIQQAKDGAADGVYRLVDTEKIGLIGHSLGGAAAVQVGRERSDIDAVINLDASLLGEYLDFVDGKPVINQAIYPLPILSIYTDDMLQLFAEVADADAVIAGKHIAATAPEAYEIHIAGTTHMSLTDVPLVAPLLVPLVGNPKGFVHAYEADPYYVIETMNTLVLQFFDAYLKHNGRFTPAGMY